MRAGKNSSFIFSRQGLSEVVAAVVLTLAALVAMAVAYSVGMLRTAPAVSSTGLLVSAHLEPFGDGGLLTVQVYNVGKEPLTLQSIRLQSGTSTLYSKNVNVVLKPSLYWTDTFFVSGVVSGREYVVEALARTQRSGPLMIIGSTEVVMR